MRLIDADRLLDRCKFYHLKNGDLAVPIIDIQHAPTIEPKAGHIAIEPRKGKWSFIGDNMFACSCCGTGYTTGQLNGLRNNESDPYAPFFCPNCGADMREVDA